ncbi:XRE family transcriptional regulator [Magnetovibrio sp. PR-2]|uniref:XRE family transcriptional regulator n=1 Tax=Magnetovibrio sp. PR-2 TaxID=3120356 RepID=UPI002FCE1040
MGASAHNPDDLWLNPEMLEWARNWRGLTLDDVAERFKKTPEQIRAWELNEASPTVKQARKLAKLYSRSFSEFFLPSPPDVPKPITLPDFRLHKDVLDASHEWEVEQLQQWVETQREAAIDLFQEVGEAPAEIDSKLFFSLRDEPEAAAEIARKTVGFSKDDQFGLKKAEAYTLPNILRDRLEAIGILTLRHSQLKHYGIRGMCIAEFPLPTIVFTKESPTAQAFTVAHEFAHILLKASGVTGPKSKDYDSVPEERWCDRFAAAFLMPKSLVEETLGQTPALPKASISDEDLDEAATLFRVSPHAMLVRLVHLEYVSAKYYWGVKKPEFDEWEHNAKGFGRAKFYGTRYQSQLGNMYTGLVMEAWSSGRLTNHNAAEYMGIKNLKHLNDIRREYYGG